VQREEASFPGLLDGQAFEMVDLLMVVVMMTREVEMSSCVTMYG
jgi:hypothetical protein